MRKTDVTFISPGNTARIYQELSKKYTTIEPPTWSLLLAESVRKDHSCNIIDINAENITDEEVYDRLISDGTQIALFVVYGQNVNAGTVSMSGAVKSSKELRRLGWTKPIAFIGSHVQALPKKTLEEEPSIDFVFTNEGVYALKTLLAQGKYDDAILANTRGIAWRSPQGIVINPAERIVPNDRMDIDLPGYAWDLLPMREKPLDLYRAPMWHAEYNEEIRSPYAAIQTSLGCQFGCGFCMINMINRNDEEEIGVASNYSKMRHWSPEFIIKEFDKLVEMGVTTIKITDELFLLNKKYYKPLCEALAARPYADKLTMWAYSRVDTVRDPEVLKLLRSSGIKWLALGIESAERNVRLEVSKGKFEDVDINKVVRQVEGAGIHVMANYIFGLPGDTQESMRKTLDFSKELNTIGWNAYGAMALPGSDIYRDAVMQGQELPDSYEGYSFFGYNTVPASNGILSSAEILKFRDEAWREYHSNPEFLERVRKCFGDQQVKNIQDMLEVRLKRRILE